MSDAKEVVRQGYNRIAKQYVEWAKSVRTDERQRYTNVLLNSLPAGASLLELGCGSGDPTTRQLAERFAITGVDLSERQIALAKSNVPNTAFLRCDMTQLHFSPASFNAVAAFYAITHVPREEHPTLLGKIAEWLKPGGLFVASMSTGSLAGAIEDDWLGAPMYFSGHDERTNRRMVEDVGLAILSAQQETADEFGGPTTFLWIVASKPL
jgi:ubiquinone/menaquinone biosynthesis C-methylase UbiE